MSDIIEDYSIGVLVVNLGTPKAPTPQAVREYLAEFLLDPYVIQVPKFLWWFILNGFILTTRPRKSAKLYQKIWTLDGSPLLAISQRLLLKMKAASREKSYPFKYALGMRYGEPSLKQALKTLKEGNTSKLIIFPLYPQYSFTTTASALSEIKKQLKQINWDPQIKLISKYAGQSSYIRALATSIDTQWQREVPGQKLLFSFHGIPRKHIANGDPYFDQCHETAKLVAAELNLNAKHWQVVFQSRFGREEWLKPYCHTVIQRLPQEGCKRVDIICPGFPIDCLETLEEIAITNKKTFQRAGGIAYNYIPALNDSDLHLNSLLDILLSKVD